jgi:hypothetical protein
LVQRPQAYRGTANLSSSSDEEDNCDVFDDMVPQDAFFTHAEVHEGQFYPGVTVIGDVVTDCFGKATTGAHVNEQWQRYEFGKGNPFAKFNSFPKQQFYVAGNNRKYKCLGCFTCPSCRFRAAPGVRAMRMSNPVFPVCPFHEDDPNVMIHETCDVVFEYVTRGDETVTLTVTGGPHRHALPPPTRLAPSTMAAIRDLISDAADGSKISPMQVQMRSGNDGASRDQRKVAYAISKTITDTFGKDLGISGLAKVTELTRRPWVRFAQPAGTAAMGDFQMVFCQLDEQKRLAAEVSKAHAQQKSKTTAFFF